MAGPILNSSILTKSTFHTFRAICLINFLPAFILLLFQGIGSEQVNPAIGIVPLFCSAAYSALLLANEKQCGCQGHGLLGTPMHLVCDVLIGVGLLIILGTYGTNFLICNFLIHLYFVLKQLNEAFATGPSYPLSCPQCRNTSFGVGNIKLPEGLKQGYAPLLDSDGGPSGSGEAAGNNTGDAMV